MRVIFAPAARAEVNDARRWYGAISPALADDSSDAIDDAIRRVECDPLMWPPLTNPIHRRPGYWRGR